MGQRELLLVLGALAIFGVILVNANSNMREQNASVVRGEFEFYALSTAKAFIEEAKVKSFDENAVNASPPLVSKNDFTGHAQLGPDGEVYPDFDDIDDFHGYAGVDTSGRARFYVNIDVDYVQDSAPNTPVTSNEFYKKMTVSVTDSNYIITPVQVSYVFGYFKN